MNRCRFFAFATAISLVIGIVFEWDISCCLLSIGISSILLVSILFEMIHCVKRSNENV